MTTTTSAMSRPAGEPARRALPARVSMFGAATFLALLALLHVLEPELDPSWRVISEYAHGRFGWMMTLAFGSLALACGALAIAVWPRTALRTGRIGAGLLAVSALGLVLAAAFPAGPLHMTGATLGGLVPFAAPLVTWALTRAIASARDRRLLWSAVAIVWAGELSFIAAMAIFVPDDGHLGPGVLVGWPNRLMIVSYCAWLIVVASVILRSCGERRRAPSGGST